MEAQLRQAEGQVYQGGSSWEHILFWAQRYREQGYTDAQVTLSLDAHGSTHGTSACPHVVCAFCVCSAVPWIVVCKGVAL